MTVGTFKGRISPLNLTEILKFLKESGKTGLLRAETDGAARALYVRRGCVIAAESSDPSESLIAILRAEGGLDATLGAACEARAAGGGRPGRALVELQAVTPAGLWEWTQRRARRVALRLIASSSGSFAFEEGVLPPPDWMLADLDISDVVLTTLRELEDGPLLASRLPEPEAIFELAPWSDGGEPPPLLPHERYVLGLVNGRRTAGEVLRMSELGDAATRRILCLMFLVGCVRHRRDEALEGAPLPGEDSIGEMRTVIRAYNDMFGFVYGYMIKEVGPIAEHVLDKYLREVRDANLALLAKVALGKDGTLAEDLLVRNLQLVRGRNRRELLVGGLNEYLYSGLLAVKRTLGADHEATVIRRLKEIRKIPASPG